MTTFAEELEGLRVAMIARADMQIAQVRDLDRILHQCDAAVMRELQAVLGKFEHRRGDIMAVLNEIATRVQPQALPPPEPMPQIVQQHKRAVGQ